jgi:hypothetical protein
MMNTLPGQELDKTWKKIGKSVMQPSMSIPIDG